MTIKADVVAQIESCIDNKKYNFRLIDFLESFIISEYKRTNDAIEKEVSFFVKHYYLALLEELHSVLNMTKSKIEDDFDLQLYEAYSSFKKKEIQDLKDFLEHIIKDCDSILDQVKLRKTKVAKKKSKKQDLSKTLKNFKFKESDNELELKSIDPKDLFKYNTLVAYDTKYNRILLYETSDKSNFVISGTTITNANCVKKRGTTKPKVLIEKMMKANSSTVKNMFNSLKGKESISSNRMNANIIMLKGFKT